MLEPTFLVVEQAFAPAVPLVLAALGPAVADGEEALLVVSTLVVLVLGLALAEVGDAPNPTPAPQHYYDRWFDLAVETFLDGVAVRFPLR